jgi:putative flavoprotein involved in K+ transport
VPIYDDIRKHDANFCCGPKKAGFKLDFGDDTLVLSMKHLRRSGSYIDSGASQLIIDGEVKLARGQVREIAENGVLLVDGTELPTDLIAQDFADRVGKCWGLGSDTTKDPGPWECEQRNMWKPTQQPRLWFQGGNLHQSRHYSLHRALQLKARQARIDTPTHGLQEVHHLS